MNLVERAKNIIITPKTEWDAVAAEEPNTQEILFSYVFPLCLIPTIAIFIGYSFVGAPFWGNSITLGIAYALITILTAFISVLLTAFVIDALAPSFGSTKNFGRALQLVAYSFTPAWVIGILNIFPVLGVLVWIGSIYSLVLIYFGMTPLMKTPDDKKIGYIIVSIVILVVVYVVIGLILTTIILGIFGLSLLSAMSY